MQVDAGREIEMQQELIHRSPDGDLLWHSYPQYWHRRARPLPARRCRAWCRARRWRTNDGEQVERPDHPVARLIRQRIWGRPTQWQLQVVPELREVDAREYICDHCGAGYLGIELTGHQRVLVCSNRCQRERQKARQRRWRVDHPSDSQSKNAKRMARRAEARSGRVCEHCGGPIEAARTTKRFCSDICRAPIAPIGRRDGVCAIETRRGRPASNKPTPL
jgi:hypothetical protein